MPLLMSRLVVAVGLACAFSGCNGSSSASAASPAAQASLLFVQNADSGVLEPDLTRPGEFLLRVRGVGPTLYISDRPQRLSGSLGTDTFAASWDAYGFRDDPPNAILETREGGELVATAVVLRDPVYDDATDTITYAARKLARLPDFYDNDERAGDVSGSFDEATLYIDNAGGSVPQYKAVTLTLQGPLQANTTVTVFVKPQSNSDAIEWSAGPALVDASAINVNVASGTIPLQSLLVNPGYVALTVGAAADGGGTATVDLQLFLAASINLEDFYLRAQADSGITVSAALGDAQSQIVNDIDTLFAWNPD